jgi:hypothetical protein
MVLLLSTQLSIQPTPRAPFYQWFAGLQLLTYVAVPAVYLLCRRLTIRTGCAALDGVITPRPDADA